MLRKMMRGKIHHATITQCDPDYVGSITIDADLLRASDIMPNEAVLVLDVDNAARFETYVIRGQSGSGIIGINGPASKLTAVGHRVIVIAFGQIDDTLPHALDEHEAKVVIADGQNRVGKLLRIPSTLDPVRTVSTR